MLDCNFSSPVHIKHPLNDPNYYSNDINLQMIYPQLFDIIGIDVITE